MESYETKFKVDEKIVDGKKKTKTKPYTRPTKDIKIKAGCNINDLDLDEFDDDEFEDN